MLRANFDQPRAELLSEDDVDHQVLTSQALRIEVLIHRYEGPALSRGAFAIPRAEVGVDVTDIGEGLPVPRLRLIAITRIIPPFDHL